MGDRTKIDWCDASWNPVTGCLHGCEYCYARRFAKRFCSNEHGKDEAGIAYPCGTLGHRAIPEGDCRFCTELGGFEFVGQGIVWNHDKSAAYPYGFMPTFHPHRLDVPQRWKKPRTIFVCSMADLFGEWVPDEWIIAVLNACREAPQHRYLFLTKNPERYGRLEDADIITDKDQNFWLGSTVTDMSRGKLHLNYALHTFLSCEPMLAPWPPATTPNQKYKGAWPEWVIFGAETGNRKNKVIPEKAWVDNAVQMCRNMGAKVFMKKSLREIMGDDFVQEFPWEVKDNHGTH